MTDLTIRPAHAADADAIARLLTQLGYPTERGGEVVGLATAHILSVLNRPEDVAQLTALVVGENVRASGVGRALASAVEDFARQAGCERLSVTTHEDRAGAQAFYPRVGLELTGRRFGKALP